MNDKAAGRLLTGRAWDDFCEQVRLAGHMVERFGDTANDLDRAEWYRFVTRLMRNGFERFMENSEPERPRLRDAPWRQGINFQSPDQDHLLAEFPDGSHSYRISGNRGTIPYFVMAAWSAGQPRNLGERDWAPRGVADLDPGCRDGVDRPRSHSGGPRLFRSGRRHGRCRRDILAAGL